MNWLSRLLGKKTELPQAATLTPRPAESAPELAAPDAAILAQAPREPQPERSPSPSSPAIADDAAAEPDATIDAEDDEEEEAEDGEADPTIGRYEPLDETSLSDDAVRDLRVEAERLALSGPHRVGPSDPAGPGSLLEALMRLEGEGRTVSRVCDDAESGFYILYEPALPPA